MKIARHVVVLAAGRGTRMQSRLPKPMLPVGGRPMIGRVLDAALALSPASTRVVVGPQMSVLRNYVSPVPCLVQKKRLGTGHALQVAVRDMQYCVGTMLVLSGDVPLIKTETLERLVHSHHAQGAAVSVLGFESKMPGSYGRLLTDDCGLNRIVEAKDATLEERLVTLCNGGVYAIDLNAARELLPNLTRHNAAKELYLTDLVTFAREAGLTCSYSLADKAELDGANTASELADLDRSFRSSQPDSLTNKSIVRVQP